MQSPLTAPPKIAKWPFFVGDAILLGIAAFFVFEGPLPIHPWQGIAITVCVGLGAILGVLPFVMEYRALSEQGQAETLAAAVGRIDDAELVATQIQQATSQWQAAHGEAEKVAATARKIAEDITREAVAFREFMEKANDAEKGHLRFEAEKLKRGETEWLQAVIRLLDNAHSLHQAALKSGRPDLISQIGAFLQVHRDMTRRVGVIAVDPVVGQPFDPAQCQVVEGAPTVGPTDVIQQVLLPVISFQGQLLRRAVVVAGPDSAVVSGASFPVSVGSGVGVTAETVQGEVLVEGGSGADGAGVVEGVSVEDVGDKNVVDVIPPKSGASGEPAQPSLF